MEGFSEVCNEIYLSTYINSNCGTGKWAYWIKNWIGLEKKKIPSLERFILLLSVFYFDTIEPSWSVGCALIDSIKTGSEISGLKPYVYELTFVVISWIISQLICAKY